jgi:hypothetical protein
MAFKTQGRYFSALIVVRGVKSFGPELTDVRPSDVRMDCKYCYEDDAPTVESHEHVMGHTMQLLCALCGAGLTEPDEIPDERWP